MDPKTGQQYIDSNGRVVQNVQQKSHTERLNEAFKLMQK